MNPYLYSRTKNKQSYEKQEFTGFFLSYRYKKEYEPVRTKTGGKKSIFFGGRCSSHPAALLKKKGE